jgi:hypothetical protein
MATTASRTSSVDMCARKAAGDTAKGAGKMQPTLTKRSPRSEVCGGTQHTQRSERQSLKVRLGNNATRAKNSLLTFVAGSALSLDPPHSENSASATCPPSLPATLRTTSRSGVLPPASGHGDPGAHGDDVRREIGANVQQIRQKRLAPQRPPAAAGRSPTNRGPTSCNGGCGWKSAARGLAHGRRRPGTRSTSAGRCLRCARPFEAKAQRVQHTAGPPALAAAALRTGRRPAHAPHPPRRRPAASPRSIPPPTCRYQAPRPSLPPPPRGTSAASNSARAGLRSSRRTARPSRRDSVRNVGRQEGEVDRGAAAGGMPRRRDPPHPRAAVAVALAAEATTLAAAEAGRRPAPSRDASPQPIRTPSHPSSLPPSSSRAESEQRAEMPRAISPWPDRR